jgi:hypothetical protein
MYIRRFFSVSMALLAAAAMPACQSSDKADGDSEAQVAAIGGQIVDVTAREFTFEAPSEIPSGWTTFRMRNAGEQEHFLVLWRLPEGNTFEDYVTQVVPAFGSIMGPYMDGTTDRGEALQALGGLLPEWFGSVVPAGGSGLTAPGRTAQTTVDLEPGNYVIECYVKTPEGVFHGMLGMVHSLMVTDVPSGATAPEADIELSITNYAIATEGELTAGQHTVRVHVVEDPEGFLKHDVHLVRLADGTGVEQVVAWMDWMDALMPPAPGEFMGGAEDMPAGHTAYVTVDLTPGNYAWVSETYGSRGVVQEFMVE